MFIKLSDYTEFLKLICAILDVRKKSRIRDIFEKNEFWIENCELFTTATLVLELELPDKHILINF